MYNTTQRVGDDGSVGWWCQRARALEVREGESEGAKETKKQQREVFVSCLLLFCCCCCCCVSLALCSCS